jgi:hypothetical protein
MALIDYEEYGHHDQCVKIGAAKLHALVCACGV